ncbi:hypothetical protein FOMPIDRAFT_93411 [Fomitopsis schrenkii]|uniref:Uncharacterized protein n=1 Tax=Fomitopsis schrenkii TaxID=2126942 RepID=S8F9V3_FOMSC|nr:hypothetical protein FOMPIDRAFT_93411 [Fomitopsis schrenkii]
MNCSVSGDLRVHEMVDMPNYVIGVMLPQRMSVKSGAGRMDVLPVLGGAARCMMKARAGSEGAAAGEVYWGVQGG